MLFCLLKRRRRRRLAAKPMPDAWRRILERHVAHYAYLDDAEREQLERDVRIFVAEKYWEGCRGMTITDEVKVAVAGQACLLLLGMTHDYYANVRTILIYPRAYMITDYDYGAGGVVHEQDTQVLGQAHHGGPIILSWFDVKRGGQRGADGTNLVYHEFAHKLDFEDEVGDGTPRLRDRRAHARWVAVMTEAYEDLRDRLAAGRRTWIDPYAATNPAEFFAVATEVFFEKPVTMRQREPALYDALCAFYGQNPARRVERGPVARR